MAAPANDLCTNATAITILPYTQTIDTTEATTSVDDPQPDMTGQVFHTVWYTYTPPSTGRLVLLLDGTTYDAAISVYTGACGALTLVDAADFDDPLGVDLTGGVAYRIMVGSFEAGGGSLTLTARDAAPVSAPVLSQGTLESTAVQLIWTGIARSWAVERCDGVACTDFTASGSETALSIANRGGLTPGGTSRFRVRSAVDLEGYGPYSNILDVTTPAGAVGLTAYGGMVRLIGNFGRADVNGHPGLIHISNALSYGGMIQLHATQAEPSGSGMVCGDRMSGLYLKYPVRGVGQVTSATSAHVVRLQIVDDDNEIVNCGGTQTLELRFRFGSVDSLTATHSNDGYIEVRVDGAVVLSATDVALGVTGTPGWGGVRIAPSGSLDQAGQNGGLVSLLVSGHDSYVDETALLYDEAFAEATDAQTWASAGGYWSRISSTGSPMPPAGGVNNGLTLYGGTIISGVAPAGHGAYSMYRLGLSPPPLTAPPPPEDEEPPDEDEGPPEDDEIEEEDVTPPAEVAGSYETHYIRRLRQAPHLAHTLNWLYYDGFELDLDAGLGLERGQGRDPQVMLRWSDDGGHTWSNLHPVSAGLQGQYGLRLLWNRLGRSRDRVFQITTSDPVPLRIADALVDVREGTS